MQDHIIRNRFTVAFDYPVVFTENAFAPDSPALLDALEKRNEQRRHRVVIYIDDGLAAVRPALETAVTEYAHAHADRFELATGPLRIPGGHAAKNDPRILKDILFTLGNLHMDRQSFVIAIGGGSVLDAVGFAVSMLHRGLRFIRMPSTVLAQADAGIGVKNGIDHHRQKNFLGTFAPPFAVINDTALLDSLPRAERLGGLAEAVKVAVIRDAGFFRLLQDTATPLVAGEPSALRRAVAESARIHLRQICEGGDPFEFGSARPLDFGHWAAHRLEIISGHTISHGHAVAAGMALDTVYARLAGMISDTDADAIVALIRSLGLPTYYPEMEQSRPDGELELIRGLSDFREHLGGRLCVTLPTGIGAAVEVNTMDESLITKALGMLRDDAASYSKTTLKPDAFCVE